MVGTKANWVNIGESWQMRGNDREGKEVSIKFIVVDRGIYRIEGSENTCPGAKVRLEDGTETVLSLQQFPFFERLDN